MKAKEYIIPMMRKIEVGPHALAIDAQSGRLDETFVKNNKDAWDDEEVEWK